MKFVLSFLRAFLIFRDKTLSFAFQYALEWLEIVFVVIILLPSQTWVIQRLKNFKRKCFDEVRIFSLYGHLKGGRYIIPVGFTIIKHFLTEIFRFRDKQTETKWPVANTRSTSEKFSIFEHKNQISHYIPRDRKDTSQWHFRHLHAYWQKYVHLGI